MTNDELNNSYFEWMYRLISDERCPKRVTYHKLLRYLHDTDFAYTIPMDGNRAEDGIDLRYRFGYENSYEDRIIAACLDYRPCSILEMMVALAIRCEEHIMDDPDIGNRTGQWFWSMISNLGLKHMSDEKFDSEYVDSVISKFLNREYRRNGEGGLFKVENSRRDLRSAEIWYQMCWYLDDIMQFGGTS